eukprot:195895_1
MVFEMQQNWWGLILILITVTKSTDETYLYSEKYVAVSIYLNWTNADDYCSNHFNTHLASIHSVDENDEIYDLCLNISEIYGCWFGLYDRRKSNNIFKKLWTWIDGTSVNYVNWSGNWDKVDEQHCAIFWGRTSDHTWDIWPCDLGYRFICNRESNSNLKIIIIVVVVSTLVFIIVCIFIVYKMRSKHKVKANKIKYETPNWQDESTSQPAQLPNTFANDPTELNRINDVIALEKIQSECVGTTQFIEAQKRLNELKGYTKREIHSTQTGHGWEETTYIKTTVKPKVKSNRHKRSTRSIATQNAFISRG